MEDQSQIEGRSIEIEGESADLLIAQRPFFRLYYWAIPVLLELQTTSGHGRLVRAKAAVYVYLSLAKFADSRSRRVRLKWSTIAHYSGICRGNVQRALVTLESAGLLTRWGQQRGRVPVYELARIPPADVARQARPHVARQARPHVARQARPPLGSSLYCISKTEEEEENHSAPAQEPISASAAALRSELLKIRDLSPAQVDELAALPTTSLEVIKAAQLEAARKPDARRTGLVICLIREPERIGQRFRRQAAAALAPRLIAATSVTSDMQAATEEDRRRGLELIRNALKGGASCTD